VLAKVGPGSSIGEFAMLDRKPRSASARALSPVTAARVSPEAYDQLLNELPDWAVSVMRALVERLRFTNDIVRTLQRSKTGVLGAEDRQALISAEFDSESRVTRIRDAESRVENDSNFDFSIYDSDKTRRI
jgi:CRP-like cAMP-binding protein